MDTGTPEEHTNSPVPPAVPPEPQPPVPAPVEPVATEPAGPSRSAARRVLLWGVITLVLLAAAMAAMFAYQAWDRERDAKTAIKRASAILEDAEADILVVDEAVQVSIASVTATESLEAASLADDVREEILEARAILDDAMPNLPDDQVELAQALRESADARADMMEIAPEILEADARAAEAIGLADQAVAEIKAAEDVSAQAAAEFNKHTAEGVRASDELLVKAEGRLQVASSLLTTASATFEGADFTPFQSYIEAKVSLIALAKQIDALWLAGDVAGSNAMLAAYNQRDAEIVAMAQALPASVRDPIANAYDAVTAEPLERYFEARERARVAGEKVGTVKQAAIPARN